MDTPSIPFKYKDLMFNTYLDMVGFICRVYMHMTKFITPGNGSVLAIIIIFVIVF